MKAVILAGGFGSRLSEETEIRPKPMLEIGGKPILWHIMKIYSAHGVKHFIICLGYKGYIIKEYFANYFLHMSDVTFDIKSSNLTVHQNYAEDWKVTLVETGANTMTGGRLKRVASYLDKEDFCFTYGDGVANIDLPALIALHKKEKRLATVTAVQQPGRFGLLDIESNRVKSFIEKPHNESAWMNGGFFILSSRVIDYIKDDSTIWEREPMQQLAQDNQLSVYQHEGYWQAMDTLRERYLLNDLWRAGNAPWKIWD